MEDKPNSNPFASKSRTHPGTEGGDHITIHGDVGAGAAVGRGKVVSRNLANRDLIINNSAIAEGQIQFTELLTDLKKIVQEANTSGELDAVQTTDIVEAIDATTGLIKKEKRPPKDTIIGKLQYVVDLIDAAVDVFAAEHGPAKVLLKALPIAALLIKLASRFFF